MIELLVSISILVILTAVAIPNIRNYGKDSDLNFAAEQVADAITEARSLAVSPSKDLPAEINYYQVKINVLSRSIQICGTPEIGSGDCPVEIEKITFSKDIRFDMATFDNIATYPTGDASRLGFEIARVATDGLAKDESGIPPIAAYDRNQPVQISLCSIRIKGKTRKVVSVSPRTADIQILDQPSNKQVENDCK